jgi:hypothetical protein
MVWLHYHFGKMHVRIDAGKDYTEEQKALKTGE